MVQFLGGVPKSNKRELIYVYCKHPNGYINYVIGEFEQDLNECFSEHGFLEIITRGHFSNLEADSFEEAEKNRRILSDIFYLARQFNPEYMREKLEELKTL